MTEERQLIASGWRFASALMAVAQVGDAPPSQRPWRLWVKYFGGNTLNPRLGESG